MRLFTCDRCGHAASFDADRCVECDAMLGYVSDDRAVRVVSPTDDPATYEIIGHDGSWWRCMNAAWGCNWMLTAATADVWCRSCRLTRGRPDEGRPEAIEGWMTAEAAKRRLVHQLDSLALPLEPRSTSAPNGLAFDLVHVPDGGAVTGHLDGVVTLDLAETDDLHRHQLRRQLNEPFRTIIGHLRHEIGHHYWHRLVGQSDHLAEFRRLFGDERADYGDAITAHYSTSPKEWDTDRFITGYAASHPLEDWAETFAHYLHIVDATDTAAAHGLVSDADRQLLTIDPATIGLEQILGLWKPINDAVNDIAASLGSPVIYPLEPSGLVIDKLAFTQQQVVAHRERDRFYTAH